MRPVYASFALFGALAFASSLVRPQWVEDGRRWLVSILSNEAGQFKAHEIEGMVSAQFFSARHQVNHGALQTDPDLDAWLRQWMDRNASGDPEDLAHALQQSHPRYASVAACIIQSPSVSGLLEQSARWNETLNADYSHGAVAARLRPARLGFECFAILGQRLPDFSPEEMGRGNNKFYSVCPLCRRGQPCEIPPRLRSVSLQCPHCHRDFALLAIDTRGRYHHVSHYLTGYAPAAHFPRDITKLDEMLLIWKAVANGIAYVPDNSDGNEANDAWQTALETRMLGTGDCEDSSIYLADWLIARGFEARVAVGRFAERGGHAWVVARLEGKTYLLEATNPEADTRLAPLAEEVGSRYVPEVTIDREGFHTRRHPTRPWDGDYWSSANWQRIPPSARPPATRTRPVATAAKP